MTRGIGLYVHIPFCASRCPYCDFATAPARTALRGRYLSALADEIARDGELLGRPRVRTLFVGGGTPSLLEPVEIEALAGAVRAAFVLRPREATVEANPATGDRARLGAWRALGITRLSLGAQSFEARGLRALGRTHQPEDSAAGILAARDAGLQVNLDLIFGWPGQSERDWERDLVTAIGLAPDHVSCYPLELRLDPDGSVANWPGGGWPVLERWRRAAAAAQPDDAGVARLYRIAERVLGRAGYRHYEIANWARPGRQSLHNLGYWRDRDWLGVGVGAHSHLAGVRSANPSDLRGYIDRIETAKPRIVDTGADPEAEAAMLALRLDTGLDLRRYVARFGNRSAERVRSVLSEVQRARLVRWSGDRARLTARGRLLASEVFVRLLS
ncbi:MAG TPA: radical SAM family heme chaperone HemW [Candidatus Limnocylindria bacterium]|jgi:oxygen-independent coproporphyrinogen-3 oxidase|nr:radical SAM family heme chaperone HemW [Candidatus Limnocylindria bacterium]